MGIFKEGLTLIQTVLGGRWNPEILLSIEAGYSRYSEIYRYIEHISHTELQRKLTLLINEKLVIKEVSETEDGKGTYQLSDFGQEVVHVIHHLLDIGSKHTA